MITVHNLPTHMVEWPEFRALTMLANPAIDELNCIPDSSDTMAGLINKTFEQHKEVVKTKLHNAQSNIHFTNDM